MDEKLVRFVDHAREKGMDHSTIRRLLVSAGWKDKDLAEVFCTRQLELPIPEPARAVPARGFLNLLAFGALHTWATSLILLLFIYINFAFPDPAWRTSYAQLVELLSVVRGQLAVVIVAFPIFLVVWHFLLREVRRDPENARGGIRPWLGYLSILVGALALSGDVITLIYYLLEGQMTGRLLLKAAALFLIAGSLVAYLVLTLRDEAQTEAKQ